MPNQFDNIYNIILTHQGKILGTSRIIFYSYDDVERIKEIKEHLENPYNNIMINYICYNLHTIIFDGFIYKGTYYEKRI